ncbi:Crp family transcriptional regulator [Chromobacterium vaccinii]|nr:Crp family transcriptional regulator [Chromobacterium vaccinii]QND90296.1 Crp family transcriptional regulator [Chromobacterium vaccinii]
MSIIENHLIGLLPSADRIHLLAHCEPVELILAEALCKQGGSASYAYFPRQSFISLLAEDLNHHQLEIGVAGCEGMLGAHLAWGTAVDPLHALVQRPGLAWRIRAEAFRGELSNNKPLQLVVHQYLSVLMRQWALSAVCMRFHPLGGRLASRLLIEHDHVCADDFHVTHEFLAHMLGVRRVSITMAAGALQSRGLIEYHRGRVVVLDRGRLEAMACVCYAANRQIYADTLGEWRISPAMSVPSAKSCDAACAAARNLDHAVLGPD